MTEVTAWTGPVQPRELSADELHGLDRLRAALAQVADRTQPRAISFLWDATLGRCDGGPAPAGFVEAVAAAVGDLLAVHLPDVHWAVWPGPHGPTLGVASAARPLAPVLPFVDARDRWEAGARDWLHDYLARASAHLVPAAPSHPQHAALPQPHGAPEDRAAPDEAAAPVATTGFAAVSATPVSSAVPDEGPAPVETTAAPAEPLDAFARDTLEHAMGLLRDTGAFDGEVLVVLVGPSGRFTDCCTGTPEQALAQARDLVRRSGAQRAALAWVERNPAGLPGPPQRFPAVVVDAWDSGAVSVRLAHRFVDDVLGTDPIGDVLPVGPAFPLS